MNLQIVKKIAAVMLCLAVALMQLPLAVQAEEQQQGQAADENAQAVYDAYIALSEALEGT